VPGDPCGLGPVVLDHLVDATDSGDQPVDLRDPDSVRLTLRSGGHLDVAPGSWIVNCASHLAFEGRATEPACAPA
jgi:hypothetical protein